MKREAEIGVMLPQAKECQKPEAMKRQGKRQNATLGKLFNLFVLQFHCLKNGDKTNEKHF